MSNDGDAEVRLSALVGFQQAFVGDRQHRRDGGQADDCNDDRSAQASDQGAVASHPAAEADARWLFVGGDRLVCQEALEVLGQVGDDGVTFAARGGHGTQADSLEGRMDVTVQGTWRLRATRDDLRQQFLAARRMERHAAGEHLVEDDAEGVDVALLVDLLDQTGGLLRGHVRGRAFHGTGAGELAFVVPGVFRGVLHERIRVMLRRVIRGVAVGDLHIRRRTLRQAPVEDQGLAVVACIPEPATGLEIKFSIQHLAAMGLDGADTGALATYSDENANDLRYGGARKRIRLDLTQDMDRSAAFVTLMLKDGRTLSAEDNVGVPAQDAAAQWRNLSAKFTSIATPVIGAERTDEVQKRVAALESEADMSALMTAAG